MRPGGAVGAWAQAVNSYPCVHMREDEVFVLGDPRTLAVFIKCSSRVGLVPLYPVKRIFRKICSSVRNGHKI